MLRLVYYVYSECITLHVGNYTYLWLVTIYMDLLNKLFEDCCDNMQQQSTKKMFSLPSKVTENRSSAHTTSRLRKLPHIIWVCNKVQIQTFYRKSATNHRKATKLCTLILENVNVALNNCHSEYNVINMWILKIW